MKEITFTRQELFDLLWSEPLIKIARKYEISDNGLRKKCKSLNIPLPNLGHWQKVQFGYKVNMPTLPKAFTGKDNHLTVKTE